MQFDTTVILKDYTGENINHQEMQTDGTVLAKPLTLREAMIIALNSIIPNVVDSPEDKAHIYALSVEIWRNDVVDLSNTDIIFIQDRVALVWNALVYGRVREVLSSSNVAS